jgi:photosystem II reaction center protein PsbP
VKAGIAALALIVLTACGCKQDHDDKAGELRSGTGYVVLLPHGWRDVTDSSRARIREPFDRLFAGELQHNFRTNVNTLVRPAPPGLGLHDVGQRAGAELRSGPNRVSEITRPRPLRIDGEGALAYDYRLQHRDPALRGTTALALRQGRLYLVTLTASARAFEPATRDFERILRSWQWD